MTRLPRAFFTRHAPEVARDLLGRHIVSTSGNRRTVGRITEVEAYLGLDDPASHAHRGPTRRNRSMYLAGGHIYVYFIYGAHYCFNFVTGPEGQGEGVLLRAIEPIEGLDHMIDRRGFQGRALRGLANGPAKAAVALGIGPEADGLDLTTSDLLWVEPGSAAPQHAVLVTPRIGITRAAEMMLRFVMVEG